MHENETGTVIVDCAVHLHQDIGPGLLETAYEVTLARKLEKRGLSVQLQVPITIEYSVPVSPCLCASVRTKLDRTKG